MTELESAPEEGLDLRALAATLEREYQGADSYHDTLLVLQRQAFQYYEGQPFGNETDGRSQIVLPDVQESVDYMAASVLRTFVSGDKTVEFEATDEEEEDSVTEASEAINYTFMRKQDGFRILHDGCVDGLLKKIGIFKTVKETREKVVRETVAGDPEALMLQYAEMGGQVDIEDIQDNGDGTVTATVKQEKTEQCFVDYAVPTNEFRFSPNARHEDDADYLCHVSEKTCSDLVEMGFDREQVESLPGFSSQITQQVESATLDAYTVDDGTGALQRVLLCEEYARIDLDNDGIAERVKVFRVGNEILIDAETGEPSIETVEDHPFAVFCPFPRPHRLVGYSLADKVMDIQLGRSFIARQLFDGMALANLPRPIVDSRMADADTYADILTPIPGSPIRAPGGAATVQPMQHGFDVGKSLQVMEWYTGERESRTGITRLNQGLDADALNKTATGTALMQSQGQQQEEFVARQLAETMARLFAKKYRLMRAEGEPFKVKVDGQYKMVDPRSWPEDVNIIVRVGLGSNSKDRRVQARMALVPIMAEGFMQGQVTPKHSFNMIDGLVRDLGIGQGDDFWVDPDAPPETDEQGNPIEKPEKPDPEQMKLQAEMQMQQAKIEGEQRLAEARLMMQQQEGETKQQLAREQAEFEAELAHAKAQQEADLAERKMAMELRLAEQRMAIEASMAEHKAHMNQQANDAKLSQNRPGGDLDK